MSDIDRRGHYVLPGMRPTPAVVAAPLGSGAAIEFVDLQATLARVALLEAREKAWQGLAHARIFPGGVAAVSGIRSGTDRR